MSEQICWMDKPGTRWVICSRVEPQGKPFDSDFYIYRILIPNTIEQMTNNPLMITKGTSSQVDLPRWITTT